MRREATHHATTPGEEAALRASPPREDGSPGRDKFLPWTEADPRVLKAWMAHGIESGCERCAGPEMCPTYWRLWKAWKAEVKRAAHTPRSCLDRQLARLGVDVLAFHVWRRERGLPRMAELTLPETERVMWWLLERASR